MTRRDAAWIVSLLPFSFHHQPAKYLWSLSQINFWYASSVFSLGADSYVCDTYEWGKGHVLLPSIIKFVLTPQIAR